MARATAGQLWRWLQGSSKRSDAGVELSSTEHGLHDLQTASQPRSRSSTSSNGGSAPLQPFPTATAAAAAAPGPAAANVHALPATLPPTHWGHSAPDAARLVLNALLEAGHAAGAEDATAHAAIAAAFAAGGCWQAACEQCRQQAVLPLLLQHSLPDGCLPPGCLEQQQQQQQQPVMSSSTSSGSSGPHQLQRQLATVVLLGEASRLCQQPGRLGQLQQLLASQLAQQEQHPLSSGAGPAVPALQSVADAEGPGHLTGPQERMQALLWPLLHAWLQELHQHAAAAAAAAEQQQQQQSTGQGVLSQHAGAKDRMAWLQLASTLLQLQDQDAVASTQQQQQQQQRPLVLLRQLQGLPVPPLLQAADLAAPLQLQQPEPPDNLQLLLLLRLSRCSDAAQQLAPPAAAPPGQPNSSSDHQHHAASVTREVQQLLARALQKLLGAVPPATAAAVRAALARKIATQQPQQPGQQQQQLEQPAPKAAAAASSDGHGAAAAAAQRPAATGRQAEPSMQGNARRKGTAAAAAAPASEPTSPRVTWPAELLGTAELFPGDAGEDDAAITREERTLRAWINSLLHSAGGGGASSSGGGGGLEGSGGSGSVLPLSPRANGGSSAGGSCSAAADVPVAGWCPEPVAPGTPRAATAAATAGATAPETRPAAAAAAAHQRTCQHIASLFGPELRSGVLLLELLELLLPGCVRVQVNRPPFHPRTAQLQALENLSAALTIAQEELGLPLVSIAALDIYSGRRKAILSLVYQLMRYHTFQLLESISAAQEEGRGAAAAAAAAGGRQQQPGGGGGSSQPGTPRGSGLQPQARQGSGVGASSSSRKPPRRRPAVRDEDILRWAHNRLQAAPTGPLGPAGDGGSTPAAAFLRDPSGLQLLRLLSVLAPDLVDPAVVRLGATPAERQSNARYALAVAQEMGCSLFLVWEDLVERGSQQRMVLVLLATLMHHDLSRGGAGGGGVA